MVKQRLNLTFELKNEILPLDYRPIIMSFIKHALSTKYPDLYAKLYGTDGRKDFCFATYIPTKEICDDWFTLKRDRIFVKFSSADSGLILLLYNAFCNSRGMEYPLQNGNNMKLVRVACSNCVPVTANKVVIKFLSPLLVRKHDKESNKDRYLDFGDDDFHKLLGVAIFPIKPKKVVVRCMGMDMNGAVGTFELTADRRTIEELYLSGMGSRRSEGFGLFDILGGVPNE